MFYDSFSIYNMKYNIISSINSIQVLQWSSLIEPTFQVAPTPGKVSKEELLMWERMRCVAWGITHYELHKESGRLEC